MRESQPPLVQILALDLVSNCYTYALKALVEY